LIGASRSLVDLAEPEHHDDDATEIAITQPLLDSSGTFDPGEAVKAYHPANPRPRFHDGLRALVRVVADHRGCAGSRRTAVLGHERPTTTLAIYTHVQGGSQERVLGALAAFSLPDEG